MPRGAPSSSITYKWSHDVFLSLYGEDTPFSDFISHLHQSLIQTGLSVFPDDEVIRRDEEISSTIVKAIHESRIVIIVFSKNYANSARCLQELVQILRCFKEEGRMIYPVFYDVDPSELQQQTGRNAEALSQAAAIPGCHCMLDWNRLQRRQRVNPFSYNRQELTTKLHDCVRAIVEQVTVWINKQKGEEEKEHPDVSFWEKKEFNGSYDVFLSYREANQFKFPSSLHDSLREGGFGVYHVPLSDLITVNEKITDKSSKALHKSRIGIIVFSKNYADSTFRLKELVQIIDSFNFKGGGRLIYPVFYDVDPKEALVQLKEKFIDKRDQVAKWRRALSEAADLPGYHDQVAEWRRAVSEAADLLVYNDQVKEWKKVLSRPADLPGYHFLPRTMNEDECIGAIVKQVTAWMNDKEKFWVWDKGDKIGSGAHGNVYVAHHWKTRAICGAIKELNSYKADACVYIRKEINFLSQLKKHPNIVEYYGHKEDGDPISLYMEYIRTDESKSSLEKNSSLEKYISKSEGGKLEKSLVQKFTAQILFGLVHLHSNRQVHRDLKPANLLVDSKDIVKLVDFGLAKMIAESVGQHSVGGTPAYAAPELGGKQNLKSLHEGVGADIWSLGCVIIEMFSGCKPCWFASDLHPRIPEELCQKGKDFLKRCFIEEPTKRPSAETLLKDPFVEAQAAALKNICIRIDGVETC